MKRPRNTWATRAAAAVPPELAVPAPPRAARGQRVEWPARAISLDEMTDLEMAETTEAKFQAWVIGRAVGYGWDRDLIYHSLHSMGSQAGFPDLVLVKGARVIFWELKSPTGKATPAQEKWIEALRAAGCVAAVVWPKDWRMVNEELSR